MPLYHLGKKQESLHIYFSLFVAVFVILPGPVFVFEKEERERREQKKERGGEERKNSKKKEERRKKRKKNIFSLRFNGFCD